ncbi:hypothetical protein [Streptomyces flavovirens]|uniref:hypothetical protein n=1 Tax=Streptomyces flavovirens TaxID=52258 RepID=UPI0031EA6C8F
MRDLIARAVTAAAAAARPRKAPSRPRTPAPEPVTPPRIICGPTTPIPAHVLALSIPSPWRHRVGPWLLAREAERTLELRVIRERRRAAVLATEGVDYYPYTYEGAPFPASAFAAAGVSA